MNASTCRFCGNGSTATCQFCGNGSTATAPLIQDAKHGLYHAWPEDLGKSAGPCPCPPPAPGFGICAICGIGAFSGNLVLWGRTPTDDQALASCDGKLDLTCRKCMSRSPRSSDSRRTTRTVVDSAPRADDALAAFKSGRATDVNSLALALDVSVDRARKQVQRLKRTGLIEVVQGGQRGRPETLRAAGEGWLLPGDA